MKLPNLSGSMVVARLRYVQSIHERPELRNPDTLVKYFLPTMKRWRCQWLGREQLVKQRADPFYYYLVARTKYYDDVVLDAICHDAQWIINIGSGSDTRAYRFERLMKQKGVKVLECDQHDAIYAKQRKAKQLGFSDHVEYLPLDLNEERCPAFENRLTETRGKSLVLMEGVSPYVEESAFCRFLSHLAKKLPAGSRIAYDFKLGGVDDEFGRDNRTQRPFRLPRAREEVAAFHAKHGHLLEHMELSSELTARLLPSLAQLGVTLFSEDGLVQLVVGRT
jgi:methyltransferase (TIGR00027 family)